MPNQCEFICLYCGKLVPLGTYELLVSSPSYRPSDEEKLLIDGQVYSAKFICPHCNKGPQLYLKESLALQTTSLKMSDNILATADLHKITRPNGEYNFKLTIGCCKLIEAGPPRLVVRVNTEVMRMEESHFSNLNTYRIISSMVEALEKWDVEAGKTYIVPRTEARTILFGRSDNVFDDFGKSIYALHPYISQGGFYMGLGRSR